MPEYRPDAVRGAKDTKNQRTSPSGQEEDHEKYSAGDSATIRSSCEAT